MAIKRLPDLSAALKRISAQGDKIDRVEKMLPEIKGRFSFWRGLAIAGWGLAGYFLYRLWEEKKSQQNQQRQGL
ncbi:hypothetical protein HYR54_07670 [Candidatus Acetothermia bacterium]|nr:hypothetical protein [Candidatus Acetothermia bacterium]